MVLVSIPWILTVARASKVIRTTFGAASCLLALVEKYFHDPMQIMMSYLMLHYYFYRRAGPWPYTPGSDGAGVITEVGDSVVRGIAVLSERVRVLTC